MKNLNRVHLNGLRALEAASRLGSLQGAAEELGVTIGAVSQQIIKAEGQLGRTVFDRTPKGLMATEFGRALQPYLSRGFRELEQAVSLSHRRDETVAHHFRCPGSRGALARPSSGPLHAPSSTARAADRRDDEPGRFPIVRRGRRHPGRRRGVARCACGTAAGAGGCFRSARRHWRRGSRSRRISSMPSPSSTSTRCSHGKCGFGRPASRARK